MEKFVRCVACAAGFLAAGAGAQTFSHNEDGPMAFTNQLAIPTFAPVPTSAQTITQSTSMAVTSLNSIACAEATSPFRHFDNSYYRGLTLSTFPALTLPQFVVQQVTLGVEQAAAAGPAQPITFTIWKATANPIGGAANPPGNDNVSSQVESVSNQSLSLLPVTLATQPVLLVASDVLAVEVFTPNGIAAGNKFFIGSNALGQTGPSYLKAADCATATITNLATLGFGTMHIVMQVLGNNQTPVELQTFGVE